MADLTSTASIRAVLGVAEKEIRDDVLLDPIYETVLMEDLYEIDAGLFSTFTTVAAVDPRSDDQQRFYDLVQTYAAYNIAAQCLGSVSMFAPITIQDSRTEVTRQADPYANLRGDVRASLVRIRNYLKRAYGILVPGYSSATASRINVLTSPLGVDPVTG